MFSRPSIRVSLGGVSVITLTTDFGTRDWFVGTMKGVIAGIAPTANVIDLTHELPPGDIRGGAFALAASYRFFPKGTIHVAVVDPGVGSRRKAIAVQTAKGVFVGPDNGVLSWALAKEKITADSRPGERGLLPATGQPDLPRAGRVCAGRGPFEPWRADQEAWPGPEGLCAAGLAGAPEAAGRNRR